MDLRDIGSLPNWLEKRYSILWKAFKGKEFERSQAVDLLKERSGDDERSVTSILSELRRAGWLEMKIHQEDARKSIYTLKARAGIREILSKNTLTRSDIETLLKRAADLIRTRVDYKFILILLFLKRISDKWELEFEEAYKEAYEDGLSDEEAKEEAKNSVWHTFNLPEEYLWENIRKDVANLPERLSKALKKIAELNPELKDVIDNVDFIQFTSNRENLEILRQLIELFSERKLHHVSPDILGDSYEWILRYFAPDKAKEGEVYTPREVIKLLVGMLDPKPKQEVYDPACGSGGMLILSYKHIEEIYGKEEAKKLFLYGQEANQTTYALCRMNLYIHDMMDYQLAMGDTLLFPKFKESDGLKQFDVVIANPPWNQDGYDENVLKRGDFWRARYRYGFTPKQSADWTWIQHMVASAKDNGKVGIVIDNGCLFRGGKERAIRARALDDDLVECVILLPEKLFYNTGAPGTVMIFNKNKLEKRKVLFINASSEYEQHPEVRKLNQLGDKNIEKMASAYNKFKEIEGFSRVVPLKEIKENDYNLNVTLYVFPEEEMEAIDVNREWNEVRKIEEDMAKVEEKIENFLKEVK
jgi:Type I restriction-modification system methyltransferase subunit